MKKTSPFVTIVTPVLNEQTALADYAAAVSSALLCRSDCRFEVLIVDDGSTDGSWGEILNLCRRNPSFKGIRLSRNFGIHAAISAGIQRASGDAVVILACDLQDPPAVINRFIEKWRAGARIVWGRRASRQDGFWRGRVSGIFYRILRKHAMPRGSKFTTGSFLLADRKVIECFKSFGEHNRITFALVAWTGFDQDVVDYDRVARRAGQSKWRIGALFKAMYDAFLSFSLLPVRLITLLGVAVFIMSLAMGVYILVAWLVGNPAPGWTSQMLALFFFFGLQFLLLGIVGEYLYRIYTEVTHRPLYFIAESSADEDGHDAAG